MNKSIKRYERGKKPIDIFYIFIGEESFRTFQIGISITNDYQCGFNIKLGFALMSIHIYFNRRKK